MYKDKDSEDGRLKLGPLWDFNIAYGNAFFYEGYLTSGWIIASDLITADYIPFWMKKIFNDTTFANQLKCRWLDLREGPLHYDNIMERIDSCANYVYEAQERNFARWDLLGQPIWPNYYYGETYEDEIILLKDWISERLVWLDNNMPGDCQTNSVNLQDDNSTTQLTLFPNPAKSNTVWLKIPACSGVAKLSVFDIVGQNIFLQQITQAEINTLKEVDISAYKSGVYIVSISDAKNTWYQKLIVE
jgi:hypothetical protein